MPAVMPDDLMEIVRYISRSAHVVIITVRCPRLSALIRSLVLRFIEGCYRSAAGANPLGYFGVAAQGEGGRGE